MQTVVGAGSVGLALAARLARAGIPVRLVTRDADSARKLESGGIRVEDPASGEHWQAAVPPHLHPGEVLRDEFLERWDRGETTARDAGEIIPVVYEELRAMARRQLRGERADHTLQPTALVHEAWMRLLGPDGDPRQWNSRGHFFTAAAEAMRRILIESARRKASKKRGENPQFTNKAGRSNFIYFFREDPLVRGHHFQLYFFSHHDCHLSNSRPSGR